MQILAQRPTNSYPSFVPARPIPISILLILGTIAAGLTLRLASFGLPFPVIKYGGSILWALMVYWIVSTFRPLWPAYRNAILSGCLALAVELFKLYHSVSLDAFRHTLPGKLLLGRIFSVWDLLAYALAITGGAGLDRYLRGGQPPLA